MWRRLTLVSWWLGVSLYFGGVLTLGVIVAPVVFHTQAVLPELQSKFPAEKMATQVGGQIFGDILHRFTSAELTALGLMLIGVAGYLFAHTPVRRSAWVLLILWALLAGTFGYQVGVVYPKVLNLRTQVRQTALQHIADTNDTAWPEKQEFNVWHDRAEFLAHVEAYLLLGMILVTAWRGLADRPSPAGASRVQTLHEEV